MRGRAPLSRAHPMCVLVVGGATPHFFGPGIVTIFVVLVDGQGKGSGPRMSGWVALPKECLFSALTLSLVHPSLYVCMFCTPNEEPQYVILYSPKGIPGLHPGFHNNEGCPGRVKVVNHDRGSPNFSSLPAEAKFFG